MAQCHLNLVSLCIKNCSMHHEVLFIDSGHLSKSMSVGPHHWSSGYHACHWTQVSRVQNSAKDNRYLRVIKSGARLPSEEKQRRRSHVVRYYSMLKIPTV
jgi:hypothetical protein